MKRIFLQTLRILQPYERRKLWLLAGLNFLVSIVDISALAMLVLVVSFYTQHTIPHFFTLLPPTLFQAHSAWLAGAFLVFFALKSLAAYLVYQAQFRFVYRVASRISEAQLLHYLEGSYSDYANTDSSVYIRRIAHQPVEFSHYILAGIQFIMAEAMLVCLALAAVLLYNPRLFLLVLLILLPAVLLAALFSRKKLKQARQHVKQQSERSLQYLHEALDGYIESNIYHKNAFFLHRFGEAQGSLHRYLAQLQSIQAAPNRLMEVFAIAGLFLLILLSTTTGGIEIVSLGAFMAAAYRIIPGIIKILNNSGQIRTYAFTLDTLIPGEEDRWSGEKNDPAHIRSIRFSQVHFRQREQAIFNGFELDIQAGEFLGIAGASGRGKTTLVNILLGFLEAEGGSISINDKVCMAHERQDYWPLIAYVKQQPFLIHDSILNNIVLDTEAYDAARLQEVLHATGLHEFLQGLQGGIHTLLSEQGRNISGGQRQRIAIARALYKQADLIILDEPFNELDTASEEKLLLYFQRLARQGKIIILITHNSSSLGYCSKVVALHD